MRMTTRVPIGCSDEVSSHGWAGRHARMGPSSRTRRARAVEPNKWCLVGGGVEEDESPEMAAYRELKEETGIICDDLVSLGQHDLPCAHHVRDLVDLFTAHTSATDAAELRRGTPDRLRQVSVISTLDPHRHNPDSASVGAERRRASRADRSHSDNALHLPLIGCVGICRCADCRQIVQQRAQAAFAGMVLGRGLVRAGSGRGDHDRFAGVVGGGRRARVRRLDRAVGKGRRRSLATEGPPGVDDVELVFHAAARALRSAAWTRRGRRGRVEGLQRTNCGARVVRRSVWRHGRLTAATGTDRPSTGTSRSLEEV